MASTNKNNATSKEEEKEVSTSGLESCTVKENKAKMNQTNFSNINENQTNENKTNTYKRNIDKGNIDKGNIDKTNTNKSDINKVNIDTVDTDKLNTNNLTKKNKKVIFKGEDNMSSTKIYYGDSLEVTPVGVMDYNDFSKQTKREQEIPGFDSKYRDFVDYIMKITHNIWEEKGIGVIYDTYHNNVTMHCGSSNLVGIKDVISNTLQTLHAFPDRRLIGQNVIWSNFGADGFLSSHRVLSTATNLGDSNFGPATGRKINFRTVIDCATTNNRIHEEWLVRDNLWIVTQLGLNPQEVAKSMAKASESKVLSLQSTYGICESMDGQFMPTKYQAKDDSAGEMMLEMTSRIYNYKYINEVKKYYHDNAVVHFICDKDLNGYDEIQGMIVSLLASIPNGSYEVERVTCNQREKNEGYDVSVRWRLRGINEGIGFFGQPSGKHIEVMGINHYHILQGKVKEEWITFDGMDVLKQMYMGVEE
ncbi:ester cyclase [Clostridioides difficile]|uniref:ester cyclase n=1 Tax=Clostridioides difficile TaxID=1496 RepID=UPI000BB1E897|nr:ester cyclase [Clostridioides difficile]PBH33959.1 polyketide cyclase [Clostridioides difficile]